MSFSFDSNLFATPDFEVRSNCAVLLAAALRRFFPAALLKGCGVNSLGFYCDFWLDQPFPAVFLEKIEWELQQMIKEGVPIRSMSMKRENAADFLDHLGHPLLAEEILNASSNIVDLVQIEAVCLLSPPSSFVSTKALGCVKLIEVSSLSEWAEGGMGDVAEGRMFRLMGVVKANPQRLKAFVKRYRHFMKSQDHRLIGERMSLFSASDSDPLGLVWHSKGVLLQKIIKQWLDELQQEGESEEIETPLAPSTFSLEMHAHRVESFYFGEQLHGLRSCLRRQHLDYLTKQMTLRPDNARRVHEWSYLFASIPENERWGLFSSPVCKAGESTVLCLKEQVLSEVISSLQFIEEIITILGFEARWVLCKNPGKAKKTVGKHKSGEKNSCGESKKLDSFEEGEICFEAETVFERAFARFKQVFPLVVEEKAKKEKSDALERLELRVVDVLEREWPVSSLSLFDLSESLGEKNIREKNNWFLISRQTIASLDRLIGLLIEKYEGKLPFWLAPEQVRVISIGKESREYASEVRKKFKEAGLRVVSDLRLSPLSAKIYEAEKESIPFLILVGEQEKRNQTFKVRGRGSFSEDEVVDIETFLKKISSLSNPKGKNNQKLPASVAN